MTNGGDTWLLNYSLAYLLYSIALVDEMINLSLPTLTKTQAGEIVFTGREVDEVASMDVSTTAYFCFMFLTFVFIAIILVSIFADHSELPVGSINFLGTSWNVSVFGVIAVFFILTGGLLMATIRAFYLKVIYLYLTIQSN